MLSSNCEAGRRARLPDRGCSPIPSSDRSQRGRRQTKALASAAEPPGSVVWRQWCRVRGGPAQCAGRLAKASLTRPPSGGVPAAACRVLRGGLLCRSLNPRRAEPFDLG